MSIAVRPENNHNALAIHQPSADNGIAQLVEWAQAAEAAHQLAVRLVDTQFVPAAYRRKPEEATAAILAGAEVGLSPMASLRAFDNIQGTPAPKAITLRAIVQSLGHDVRIDESTDQVATVSARRRGSNDWQTSTWTIQRAQQAGYPAKNGNWKTAPAAMLIARATAEVCRWVASDAIMGMPYSAEEIRDEGPAFDARTVPPRVTAAEILGIRDAGGSGAERAGEADAEPTAAAAAQPELPVDDDAAEMIRDDQRGVMFALWDDLGFGGDDNRANRLVITAKILGLSEPLESSDALTFDEAETVITALKDRKAAQQAAAGGES